MKKGLIIIFILQGIAFLAITYYKYMPGLHAENRDGNTQKMNAIPDDLKVWEYFNQATDYRIVGDYQQAIQYYKQALAIDPAHQNSLYYLGSLQMRMKHYGEAEKNWDQLVKVNPYSSRGHAQLGTVYCYRDPENHLYNIDKSIYHFRKAAQLNKEETGPLLELAKIDLVNNRIDSAAIKLNDVVSSNFRSMEAIFLQGYLSWKKGDTKHAKIQLEKSISIEKGKNAKFANVGEGATDSEEDAQHDALQYRLFSHLIANLILDTPTVNDDQTNKIYRHFEEQAKL